MKKEITGWWFFYLVLAIITIGALSILGYMGKFTGVVVERKVFEQSYQKQAGDSKRIAAYRAQLATINSLLPGEKDPAIRRDLAAQKSMLEVQIRSTK